MSGNLTIGQRIKAVRRRAGLGQEAFAAALGYSKRSLIAWEKGAVDPPIAILLKLRNDFDVDPEWIVMGEDETPRSHYGPVDWKRFDQLTGDVKSVCIAVGLDLPAERHQSLARVLYDDGEEAGRSNQKRLRGMLIALSLEKP